METYGVGLVGWGTVGGGVVRVLQDESELLRSRTGLDIQLRHIVTRNPARVRDQDPGLARLGSDLEPMLADPEVRCVLHLVGGVDEASRIAEACLRAGKHLVTANKAMLAEHWERLFATAADNKRTIAFEAAVAGGIPVIAALRDGLVANRIRGIQAILNGTCNYILTRMERDGSTYDEALAAAKALGYAEADPTLDVDGTDTAHKLAILARIAFAGGIGFASVSIEGIQNLTASDIASAARMGCRIKLLAAAEWQQEGLVLRVAPTLVPLANPLAAVMDNYNGVLIQAHAAGPTLLVGQGAGAAPTASAVIADLVDVATGRATETAKRFTFFRGGAEVRVLPEAAEVTASFARFRVPDRAGVLAQICTMLSQHGVSLLSVYQGAEASSSAATSIEVTTHPCRGGEFLAAIAEIDQAGVTVGPSTILRRLA